MRSSDPQHKGAVTTAQLVALTLLLALLGCGQEGGGFKGFKPAKVEHSDEGMLARITLQPEAEARLGIQTVAPTQRKGAGHIRAAGAITVPPGSSAIVTAPVAGIIKAARRRGDQVPLLPGAQLKAGDVVLELAPLVTPGRDLRVDAERDLSSARARLSNAQSNEKRLTLLGEQGAGDQSALEQAQAARGVAEAELAAARKRLSRLSSGNPLSTDVTLSLRAPSDSVLLRLHVASGQSVAAGAPLFEVANIDHPWVTTSVYVGDLSRIDRAGPALVRAFGETKNRAALPVAAPAQGDPVTATATLQYALQGDLSGLFPGQRVEVLLPRTGDAETFTTVPESAMLYDLHGKAWTYAKVGEHSYERRPLNVAFMQDHVAYLATPLPAAEEVVVQGAAELFGTEFGAGK